MNLERMILNKIIGNGIRFHSCFFFLIGLGFLYIRDSELGAGNLTLRNKTSTIPIMMTKLFAKILKTDNCISNCYFQLADFV